MGYDISYHPIGLAEMKDCYFDRLLEVENGDFSKLQEMGQQGEVEEFYINKYIETMKVAVTTEEHENFEKTHAYYLAVIQGFFHTYYYTRGTSFSFLAEEKPGMRVYITSWNDLKPSFIGCPVEDTLAENYSGGVYLGPDQVVKLLEDYESDEEIHQIISDFFEQNTSVFIKSLKDAIEHHKGLLEATEVVEPQPLDLSKTTSFSNLMNCDRDGAYIYQETARAQIAGYAAQENLSAEEVISKATYQKIVTEPETKPETKQNLWQKLFKKNR